VWLQGSLQVGCNLCGSKLALSRELSKVSLLSAQMRF
jgi:hypothetical protein